MIKAVTRGLCSLARFSGRESGEQFWPYAVFVLVLAFAGAAASILPQLMGVMDRMQKFAAAHPDQAHVESSANGYSITIEGYHPELMPDFGTMMAGMQVMVVVIVILLAAAVARRLHDRGRTGFWGLLPLPFLTYGMVAMPKLFAGFAKGGEPDLGQFFLLFGNNVAYIGVLLLLAWQLMGKSDSGANRFGPPSGMAQEAA
jgi:uncharacterized membrane protein YhaH (DUF805 family)